MPTNSPNPDPGRCRREFFRLRYPLTCRPSFLVDDAELPVTELSEQGMRLFDKSRRLQLDHALAGLLVLPARRVEVMGFVTRRDGREVVITEVAGVTFQLVMEEQRRIIQKLPQLRTLR